MIYDWSISRRMTSAIDPAIPAPSTTASSPARPLSTMQYLRLGSSGLKTSKIILGCMAFGSPTWEGSPWTLDEEASMRVLKRAWDVGINTWDTANTYSNGESERILGKFMKQEKIPRSKAVILSKVYYPVCEGDARPQYADMQYSPELVNQMGLSRKHIFDAVDGTLERLGTTYIDVLQIHRLDRETQPKEIMRALHDLVAMGKVRYLGASSMRCWEFAELQYVLPISFHHSRDGKMAVLTTSQQVHCVDEWLDPLHKHAALLQPPLPRRGA
jgi:aryl-alcohol dehydrogenase-like predicted oxidoreductase